MAFEEQDFHRKMVHETSMSEFLNELPIKFVWNAPEGLQHLLNGLNQHEVFFDHQGPKGNEHKPCEVDIPFLMLS